MSVSNATQDAVQFGLPMRRYFSLSPAIAYLNHGAFGAVPSVVHDAQSRIQRRMELEPSRFFEGAFLKTEMRAAAQSLADYLGCTDADHLALIENATIGINAVLRHLDFTPGDEILITDQTYGAVDKAARYIAKRTGATVKRVALPFPATDHDQIIAAFSRGLGPRTRLAIIDHVTSPTALVLPVAEMSHLARSVGAKVLIDGAHAPGMVPINFQEIAADWYTGNCHKWLFAARGCGFLWTSQEVRDDTHPLVISHGYGDGFTAEFDWVGTRDVSAQLSLPAALQFRQRFGDRDISAHNHRLVMAASQHVAAAWNSMMGGGPALTGAMCCVCLPEPFTGDQTAADKLRWQLADTFEVQVPLRSINGRFWARLSAQIYNDMDDYHRFAKAILKLQQQ